MTKTTVLEICDPNLSGAVYVEIETEYLMTTLDNLMSATGYWISLDRFGRTDATGDVLLHAPYGQAFHGLTLETARETILDSPDAGFRVEDGVLEIW